LLGIGLKKHRANLSDAAKERVLKDAKKKLAHSAAIMLIKMQSKTNKQTKILKFSTGPSWRSSDSIF
jgi:CHASE3 domain sensor protein